MIVLERVDIVKEIKSEMLELQKIDISIGTFSANAIDFLPISILIGAIIFVIGWLLWKLTIVIIKSMSHGKKKLDQLYNEKMPDAGLISVDFLTSKCVDRRDFSSLLSFGRHSPYKLNQRL